MEALPQTQYQPMPLCYLEPRHNVRGFEMPNPPSNLDTLTKLANWINSLKFAGLYFYDVKGGEAGSISTLACSMNGNGAIDYRAVIIKTRDTANARSTISLCDQAGENSIADITADTIDLWGKKRIDLHGEVYPSSHVRMINQAQLQGYTTGGTPGTPRPKVRRKQRRLWTGDTNRQHPHLYQNRRRGSDVRRYSRKGPCRWKRNRYVWKQCTYPFQQWSSDQILYQWPAMRIYR